MSGDADKHPGRAVRTFGFASFLNDMGSDMLYPVWPLFVTSFLGAHALEPGSHFFRNLLVAAAIPSIVATLLVLFRVHESAAGDASLYRGYSLRHVDANFGLYLTLNAVFSLGAFSYSFLLLHAKEAGFPLTSVPVLYLVFTAVATFTARCGHEDAPQGLQR